jgi:hypothetical protein
MPNFVLMMYWTVLWIVIFPQKFVRDDSGRRFPDPEFNTNDLVLFLISFVTVILIGQFIRFMLVLTDVQSPLGMPNSSTARFSIHFGPLTTTLLLCICLPLSLLLFYLPHLPVPFVASSICATFVLAHFALLWLLEFLQRDYMSFMIWDDCVGKGNEALDECYRRLYAKSRFTRWVEMGFGVIYTASRNWWRSFAAWRNRARATYRVTTDYEEGGIQPLRGVRSVYTDDGDEDPEGDLLMLGVEDG